MNPDVTVIHANGAIGDRTVDIRCLADGIIDSVVESSGRRDTPERVVVHDLGGRIVLPGLVEPHAHMDKAFLADRVANPGGDLMGAIAGLDAVRDTLTFDDIVERSTRAAVLMSRNGVVCARTHADTTLSGGLTAVTALLETKRRCASFIDIQVAALLEWPLTGRSAPAMRSLALEAIAAGVDVIGGCPHLDDDPVRAAEILLALALEAGLPLDVHADENLRPDSRDLETIADIMIAGNISHPVTASHCVSLSVMEGAQVRETVDKVSRAGISVVALPQTNLFLQARGNDTQAMRGIAPTRLLRESGVNVAAGADNLQDPFNPMGRADPLETANLMVLAAHETPIAALDLVSTGASRAVRSPERNLLPGTRADFVAVRATSVRESIAMGPPDRIVVYGGVVITEQDRNIK